MTATKSPQIIIADRKIGPHHPPFIIAEIGINHEGSISKAMQMIDAAADAGAECVKFQSHFLDDEMVPAAKKAVPGHTKESIWEIMARCVLTPKDDIKLKKYVEKKGMIYLSTPFSRAAANHLHSLGVKAFKIGSGECNNYPLVEHIASFGKPVIMSTGMNNLETIKPAVAIFKKKKTPFALLHCTSLYPTPYDKVRLGALGDLQKNFPGVVVGSSDHSLLNYTAYAAVALGASIIEKHFTLDKRWKGPDIGISITPPQLAELIEGTRAIYQALGGKKDILSDEKPTINFAYACVVAIQNVARGQKLTKKNIWVKRPGTGQIKAKDFDRVLGKEALKIIKVGDQLKWADFH